MNWGDGSPVESVAAGSDKGNGVAIDHVFKAAGSFTVEVRATDKDGTEGSAARRTVVVTVVALQAGTLVAGGTTENDAIVFNPGGGRDAMKVIVNGVSYTFTSVARVVAYGQEGNDDLQVAGGLGLPAALYGGDGNDTLKGGNAPNVLVGGADNDAITGGTDRDVIVGGAGADTLNGGPGDDLPLPGDFLPGVRPTEVETALGYVFDRWTRSASYADLYAFLAARVRDDDDRDVLAGASGQDWFWANLTGPVTDVLADRKPDEGVVDLYPLRR